MVLSENVFQIQNHKSHFEKHHGRRHQFKTGNCTHPVRNPVTGSPLMVQAWLISDLQNQSMQVTHDKIYAYVPMNRRKKNGII
jgi:hypothetical protein